MLKKYSDSLNSAKARLEIAEHMIKVGVGIIGEKRILAKALIELQKSVSFLIDALLYYEPEKNKIKRLGDKESRAQVFFNKISRRYLNKEENNCLKEVLILTKKHKNAHLEFVKKDKFIIFNGETYDILTTEGLKNLIFTLNNIINRLP